MHLYMRYKMYIFIFNDNCKRKTEEFMTVNRSYFIFACDMKCISAFSISSCLPVRVMIE